MERPTTPPMAVTPVGATIILHSALSWNVSLLLDPNLMRTPALRDVPVRCVLTRMAWLWSMAKSTMMVAIHVSVSGVTSGHQVLHVRRLAVPATSPDLS